MEWRSHASSWRGGGGCGARRQADASAAGHRRLGQHFGAARLRWWSARKAAGWWCLAAAAAVIENKFKFMMFLLKDLDWAVQDSSIAICSEYIHVGVLIHTEIFPRTSGVRVRGRSVGARSTIFCGKIVGSSRFSCRTATVTSNTIRTERHRRRRRLSSARR